MVHLRFIAIILLSSVLVTGCKKSGVKDPGKRMQSNVQKPIEIAQPLVNAFSDFSFSFYKELLTDTKANENIFVSPLSLHIALGMLVNGAQGETKTEIMKLLKADNLSSSELNNAYTKLLKELPEADPLVKMALANAIFYRNTFPVQSSFLNTMKTAFYAQVAGLPFDYTSLVVINKWASDNTNGKITKVLDEINPNLMLILMNALYFKGDWRSKFDKANTKDQSFYFEGGGQKTVKMMNQKDTFKVAGFTDYSTLQLPYGNGQFIATLLLPRDGKTIGEVMKTLNTTQFNQIQSASSIKSIEVGLPKFKLSQEFMLNNVLKKSGMVRAFNDIAEFEPMSNMKPLFVGFVKQNTFAAVDEEGTEAAAVTTIGMVTTSMPVEPPKFLCNKPFGIIISEKTSGVILFMGQMLNPSE